MKETKNVPQLRFSGFDDEWEEKKLNEYLEPSKQKNLDNKYHHIDQDNYHLLNNLFYMINNFD